MNALTVEFHGHSHTLIEHGGEPHVAMRPIVEAIGLNWASQFVKIKEHPVMGACVVIITTQAPGDIQRREIFALPLKYLNGWLFGVDSRRVKADLRETLIAYQRECFAVLDKHWRGGNRVDDPTAGSPEPALPPSVSHQADHISSAARVFRSLMKLGFEARLPRHRVLASANAAALNATGYDIAAVFGMEDDLLPPPEAPGSALALPRASTVADWLSALRSAPRDERPRGPVLTTMAHQHYMDWCRDSNRGPLPLARFAHVLRVEHGVQQARKRMRDERGAVTAPLSVLYLGEEQCPPRGHTETQWIGECHWQFWAAHEMAAE